jgi:hypothetical protein
MGVGMGSFEIGFLLFFSFSLSLYGQRRGGAIRSFTGFPSSFIMSFLLLLFSFLSLPSHAYSLQIVRWVFLLAHVMDRTGW